MTSDELDLTFIMKVKPNSSLVIFLIVFERRFTF